MNMLSTQFIVSSALKIPDHEVYLNETYNRLVVLFGIFSHNYLFL